MNPQEVDSNQLNDIPRSGRLRGCADLYARTAMQDWERRWWWAVYLPVVILVFLGVFSDWRFAVVGGIILFAVNPLGKMYGWVKSLSDPDAVRAVWDFEIAAEKEGELSVRFFIPEVTEVAEEKMEVGDEDSPELYPHRVPDPIVLKTEDLLDVEFRGKNILLYYPGMRFIIPTVPGRERELRRMLDKAGILRALSDMEVAQ